MKTIIIILALMAPLIINAEITSFSVLKEHSYPFRWDPYLCQSDAIEASVKAKIEADNICKKLGYSYSQLLVEIINECTINVPTVIEVFEGEFKCIVSDGDR